MGKIMSIVMKNKLTATALALTTIMGMGYSTLAAANDSADFTTTINVVSENNCIAQVSKGATGTEWALTWTLPAVGDSSIDYTRTVTTPLEVLVSINDGPGNECHLNDMTIAADMKVAEQVSGSAAYKVPTQGGGFWRYMPVVAQAKLFTDTAYTTAVSGVVNVIGADGGKYSVSPSSIATAYEEYTPLAAANWGSNPAVVLSDGYVGTEGYAPLTVSGAPTAVAFTMDATGQNVDSAIIGISAVIASDPEDGSGNVDTSAALNGETITMPFTINVTWA